jgi:thioredoxin-like negative regulator of GroEL
MASKNVVEFTSDNWQAEVAQSAQPVDVTTIPRVLVFKGGDKPLHQIVGLTPEAELVKLLNGALTA